ncbi:MAG: hypothetical protein M3R38_02310 [Actinomycetota bacterium]|nr:hypothetical protein [Actinomycetota bacterium]
MARDRFGRQRPAGGSRALGMLVAVAGALLVAWVLGIALLGGREETAAQDAPQGDASTTTMTPEPTTAEPAAPQQDAPLVQGEPVSRPEGEAGREAMTPEEGAAHEPAGHDPLGTGAEPDDLTETDKGRVEAAARNFVTSAYGYTGRDDSEYGTQLNRFIFPWSFYESPGARYVQEYRQRIRTGGTESTATLERFELAEGSQKAVKGVAYFRVEDSSGTRQASQELELEPFDPVWRVKSAGEMKTKAQ